MEIDRSLFAATAATRHLLESRLHMVAAIEAMSDIEGFTLQYDDAVQLRHKLDEMFMTVEDRAVELWEKLGKQNGSGKA